MVELMMWLVAIAAGFVLGFFGSMPPTGPIAVLVLQRGVLRGYREAVAIAFGAAIAECIYCGLATFGLSALFERFPVVELASRFVGVALLVALGIHFVRFRPKEAQAPDGLSDAARQRRGFLLGFGISAANPVLIVTWSTSIAMLYSFGRIRFGLGERVLFALAVGGGVFCWFRMLLAVLRRHSERFTISLAGRLVRGAGFALIGVAVVATGSMAWHAGVFR